MTPLAPAIDLPCSLHQGGVLQDTYSGGHSGVALQVKNRVDAAQDQPISNHYADTMAPKEVKAGLRKIEGSLKVAVSGPELRARGVVGILVHQDSGVGPGGWT